MNKYSLARLLVSGAFLMAAISGMADAVKDPIWRSGYGELNGATVSPDGRYLVTVGDWGGVVWDIESGAALRTFNGQVDALGSVAVSPDGRYIAAGPDYRIESGSTAVYLWDFESGRLARRFVSNEGGYFREVTFSPDGTMLLTAGGYGYPARLWDVETGQLRRTLTSADDPQGDRQHVAFSPDGSQVLTGGSTNVQLWDVATGLKVRKFPASADVLEDLAFSPDGQEVVATYGNGDFVFWNCTNGLELRRWNAGMGTASIGISPDGKRIVAGAGLSADWEAELFDAQTGQLVQVFNGPGGDASGIAGFLPDGHKLVTYGSHEALQLWDVETGQEIRRFEGHSSVVYSLAFSPDGRQLLAGGAWPRAFLIDSETGERDMRFSSLTLPVVYQVAFSPDGTKALMACGGKDHAARLWDVATGQEELVLPHPDQVWACAFSPDGQEIATRCWDDAVRIWDAHTGQLLANLPTGTWSQSIAYSPDGTKVMATVREDGVYSVKVWDRASLALIQTLNASGLGGWAVFSPDGKRIATTDKPGLKVWDASTGQQLLQFNNGEGGSACVAFSPDGRKLASGEKTVRLWDASTGQELRRFTGHIGLVLSVAFSPDGRFVASSGEDGTVQLWPVYPSANLKVESADTGMNVTWETGTLQEAESPQGPWTDLPDAVSPYPVQTGDGQQFFRVKISD